MKQRILGRTGVKVSEISFGGVEIGLPYGIGVNNKTDMLPESQAIRLLHSALDRGINLFDTARTYGTSESIMGKAFKDRRKRVVICTKCRHFRDSDGQLPSSGQMKNIIETSLNESLVALKTEFVDVYMLHQSDPEILANDTVADTFLNLKQAGNIRATGVSTYSVQETKMAIESDVWDVIQLPFNLMNQSHETQFSIADRQGIGIMVRSVLLKGILSEKGRNLHPALEDIKQHLRLYEDLLSKDAPDLSTVSIKFALSFQQVSSVLVGIDKIAYLENALTAADGVYLDEKTLQQAKELCFPDPDFLDLVKWDKMGWLT